MRHSAARFRRAVLGRDLEPRVRAVAAISLIYSASLSTFWGYIGVFAVEGLHWRPGQVGLLFLVEAPMGAVANYLSGHLSDRIGRKRPIIASFLASSVNVTALAVLGGHTAVAFGLIALQGVIGAPAYSLDRVLVADLVHEDDGRELAYATVRVAGNLGAFAGPPVAALLISVGGWSSFLIGIAGLGLAGTAITAVFLPETGGHLPGDLTRPGSLRLIARDRPFLLLLLSTMLGFFVYCGFETVLPVIAVSSYGLPAPTWGLLVAIGPLLIVLGQIRLTLAVSRVPTAGRMAAALLCMGLPFLTFIASNAVIVIALVIAVFIVGEMVWMPTSQMLAAELAPAYARGAYLGAVAATTGVAWTITPLIALQLRAHIGVASVWIFFAAVALAAVATGLAAVRAAGPHHGL